MKSMNKSNYQDLDDLFGTDPTETPEALEITSDLPTVVSQPAVPTVISTGDDIEDDYQVARKKLNDLIDKSQQALDGMLNVALASDSPRAYEVVGQLIKTGCPGSMVGPGDIPARSSTAFRSSLTTFQRSTIRVGNSLIRMRCEIPSARARSRRTS